MVRILRSLQMMAFLTLLVALPGILLLFSSKLTIESALVKRQMDRLVREQQQMIKRNQALKSAIASISREVRIEELYKTKHGRKATPRNRVVRLQIAENR